MSRSMQRRRSNSVLSRQEARRRAAIGCAVESLEERRLFSTLTVNTTADDTASDGALSLREAIALIQNNGDENAALGRSLNGGEAAQVDISTDPFGTNDTIVFDNSLAGGTIVLGSSLQVDGTMVIDGGSAGVTLSGGVSQASWRAFFVTSTADLTLNGLTITNFSNRGADGNLSVGGDAKGGAIYVDRGTLTITNGTLSNNAAVGGDGDSDIGGDANGGAIYVDRGTLTITNGTLSNNAAVGGGGDSDIGGYAYGGAIFVSEGTLTVTGSTLANNTAAGGLGTGDGLGIGGAIYTVHSGVTVDFSTLSANAADMGRGLYVDASDAAPVAINNSILGQADDSVTDLEFSGTVNASGLNNLIRNMVAPGIGNLSNADPKLGPLQNNGGPTQTMRPAADSPAIDAADDTLGGAPSTDQRGAARPAGAYDIGAVEFAQVTLTVSSTGDDDTRDSNLTLREAFHLIDGTLAYGDLTAGEQAWLSAPVGDAYDIVFDASIAGGTITLGDGGSGSAFTISTAVTIDGGASGVTLSGGVSQAAWRAFYVNSTGNLTLNNLAITNFGNRGADGSSSPGGDGLGGAIYVDQGTLAITNGTLSNNAATGGIGALANAGSGRGGAIYVSHGIVTLTNSTLSNNTAAGGAGFNGAGGWGQGGAVYNDSGTLTIIGTTLSGNDAVGGDGANDSAGSAYGGAVCGIVGTLAITDSTLSGNSAAGGSGFNGAAGSGEGGAVFSSSTTLTITGTTLSNNTATGGGGSGNGGDGLGGAVRTVMTVVTVTNSTLASNSAVGGSGAGSDGIGQGGAIYDQDGSVDIGFSTVSSNTAAQGGRGLFVVSGFVTTVEIDNSIFGQADNSVTDVAFAGSVAASGSNNLIRNTSVIGIGILSNADPKLGALQYNGGPTQTMRPAADSPALDAGDDTLGGAPSADQRGIARTAGTYDVGAYELATATLTVTGTDDDDTRDTVLTLREAFRLIDGRLDYADLTVDEQALISGTLGDVYFIEFDSSLAGATFGISEDDSLPIPAPPIFTPPTYGPTAFTVSKTVTITGLDDGNGNHINLAGNAFDLRLFLVTATGDLTLKNLTIGEFVARGDDDGFAGENVLGGAILINGGTVTIEDSAFVNNRAIAGDGGIYGGHAAGGAIYNAYGTLTIRDSQFQENSAIGGDGEDDTGGNARGGAIYSQGGTVSLDMVNFLGNEALGGFGDFDGGGAYGGAIYTDGGTVTAQFLGVVGNRAAGGDSMDGDGGEAFGGGIYFADGTFDGTLVGLVMNQANGGNGDGEGGDAHGGAVFVENGTFNLTTFGMMDNAAHGGDGFFDQGGYAFGGALAIGGGAVTLIGGQLTGNSAVGGDSEYDSGGDASGGAVDIMLGGELTLVSATVAQNAAHAGVGDGDGGSYGGAIHAYNSDLTINFSTISGNQAGGIRGVLFEIDNGSHLIAIDNSILGEADDSDYDLVIGEFGGTLTRSGSHNLIRVTDATGIGIVSNADPRLAPLGSYGDMFFQTMALLPDSPALDAGGSAGSVTEDARGADRVYNGTADIGAFESQGYTLAVNPGSTPQSAVVGNAFGSYLTVTLTENFDDAPIPGATVSFAVNTSGSASATFATTATTDIDGKASAIATANGSAGSYTVTASVGGSGDQAESADFSLTNTAVAPAITSANHGTFTVGSSGSFTITTTGTPTVTLSKSGTLPAGVTFVDNGDGTATLSGTPTASGTFTLTITAHNDGSPDATQTFTLTVNQAPAITSASFAAMTAGTAGTFTITTTGFPVATIAKNGTLPAGLTFTDNGNGTATLSGTPAAGTAGTYVLTISVDNGVGSIASQTFTLTVSPAPVSGETGTAPTITSPAALSLVAGQAGTFTVTTTGSPIPALQVSGTLPAGVTFVDNGDGTGTFSGTATAVGTYAVSVVADNGVGGPVTQALAITVNGARPIIVASGYAGGTISINNPDGTNRFTISNPFKKKNVGVRLASADLNGDGVADIIAAAGTSGQPQVIVYDGLTGDQLTSFMAFNKAFTGGVFVAAADVNHDGTPDIVVGQGIGGTSKVRVFSGKDSSLLADFNPFGTNAGGARVAAADLNGDGFAEVIAGQGFGGGQSMVKVIDGKALSKQGNAKTLSALSQAQLGFAGGAFVATGDVNGDGTPDVLVSQSVGTKPYVTVVDGKKAAKNNLKSAVISKFRVTSDDGARITSNDVNGDGFADIITSVTVKGKSLVKIFSGADGSLLDTIESDGSGKGFVA